MSQLDVVEKWIKLRMCVERVGPKQCIARPYVMYWCGDQFRYVMLTPEEKESLRAHVETDGGELTGWGEVPAGMTPGSRAEIDPGGMYSFED